MFGHQSVRRFIWRSCSCLAKSAFFTFAGGVSELASPRPALFSTSPTVGTDITSAGREAAGAQNPNFSCAQQCVIPRPLFCSGTKLACQAGLEPSPLYHPGIQSYRLVTTPGQKPCTSHVTQTVFLACVGSKEQSDIPKIQREAQREM